jgi:hypothetical protein
MDDACQRYCISGEEFIDLPACSAQTWVRLGWQPNGPGLICDLERLEIPAA